MLSASWPACMPISATSPASDEPPLTLRSLARASALFTFANIVPKVGALLLVPIYVRLLSTAEYGTLALATTVIGLLTTVCRLGMDGSLMRLHFDADGPLRGQLYSSVALTTLAIAALVTVVGTGLGLAIVSEPILGIDFVPVGILTLLVALTTSLAFIPSVFYRATRQAARFAVFNIGGFLLTSMIVVVLVVVIRLGVAGVLLGQLLAGTVLLSFAIFIAVRAGGLSIRRSQLRAALSFGLPLVPHQISGLAIRLVDRWLIGLLIGLPAAQALGAIGVYTLGYQIGSVVTIILTSVNSAWSPYFFGVGHHANGPRLHREMTTIVVSGLLLVAVGLSALASELVRVIARPGYEAAADVIAVVSVGAVVQGFYTMCVTVVFFSKRTRPLALMTGASAILNVMLNLLLIPQFGIMGAAWATVGGYASLAVATLVYASRIYPISINIRSIALSAGLGIATVMAARSVQPDDLIAGGVIHLALVLAYAGVLVVILREPVVRLRLYTRAVG